MPIQRIAVKVEMEPQLRLYRRLWLSRIDLQEAKATIEEILNANLPFPRRKEPTPLLAALTTALVVSYASQVGRATSFRCPTINAGERRA